MSAANPDMFGRPQSPRCSRSLRPQLPRAPSAGAAAVPGPCRHRRAPHEPSPSPLPSPSFPLSPSSHPAPFFSVTSRCPAMDGLAAAASRRCRPDPVALGPILPSPPRSAPPSSRRRAAAAAVDRSAAVPPCARRGRGRRPAPVPCRARGPPPPRASAKAQPPAPLPTWAGSASSRCPAPPSPPARRLPWPRRLRPPLLTELGQGPREFQKRLECEDSFDYVGSSSSWIRSSSKRDLSCRYR